MKDKLDKKVLDQIITLARHSSSLSSVCCDIHQKGFGNLHQDDLVFKIGGVLQCIAKVCDSAEIPWDVIESAANKQK